ncbi:MAG: metallophosphoesterase [Promethearchaeota archaeon]
MIYIGAVGDVHSPKYLPEFSSAMEKLKDKSFDLFILAGDTINKGFIKGFTLVVEVLNEYIKCPIIACFGNEDYIQLEEKFFARFGGYTSFLNDSSSIFHIKDKKIGIIGTRGVLDKPTSWQAANIPNILEIYEQRLHMIDTLLNDFESKKLSKELDYSILISHYAVGYSLLLGEKPQAYPLLGSSRLEKILSRHENLPTVVIHAHAHNATKFRTELGPHTLFNVSFPATRSITCISLPLTRQFLLTEF